MFFSAQADPNTSTNYLTDWMAASLTANTLSANQSKSNFKTFSFRNSAPIALAKNPSTSMVWALIRQFLSWASSVSAGMTDWLSDSTPKTLVIKLSFLKRVILTSESWSLRRAKKIGRICSLVDFLPSTGDSDKIDDAKEFLTNELVSDYMVFKRGSSLDSMSSASSNSDNPSVLRQAIDFISGSGSWRNLRWYWRKTFLNWSFPTAYATSTILSQK